MRGELVFWLLVLSPALMAPKGCYYGSDVVPLGYNAAGGAYTDAGASNWGDAGDSFGAGPSTEQGGYAGNLGAAGSAESGGAAAGATSGAAGASSGAGGAGHGGTTVVVLRPH